VLEAYDELRSRVTAEADALFEHYAGQLQCRRGCYFCCDAISVLPIEYQAMRRALAERGLPPAETRGGPPEDAGLSAAEAAGRRSNDRTPHGTAPNPETGRRRCCFLGREGECTVYPARPVICRTHGLPLAYRLYEYDADGKPASPTSYIDSWCDLNFTHLDDGRAAAYFDGHGRICMARVNETLERLNKSFLETVEGARYRERQWIPLSELVTEGPPRD
jgi:Fe-S-cluster containining protein